MKIDNTLKYNDLKIQNRYNQGFTGGKKYLSGNNDTIIISSKSDSGKSGILKQKILNLFGLKQKNELYTKPADIEIAQEGFDLYQSQSFLLNWILRKSPTVDEAIEKLSEVGKMLSDKNATEAFFVEKGYDILSKPLEEDTTVLRYIFSKEDYNIDWKPGDRITEKAFISTTLDRRENSYPKYYVKENLKNYNNDSDFQGQLYTMEITIPKGTKVVKRDDDSMQEILLKYGTTLQVADFNSETNTYKCNVI